jgi:hypothetical protein
MIQSDCMNNCRPQDSITASEYVEALHKRGIRAFLGQGRVFWLVSERIGLGRYPESCFDLPLPGELRKLFWRSGRVVANYLLPVDDAHPANAVLYLCTDRGYHLEALSAQARRNARRAQRAFRFEFLDSDMLLAHGATAYCDTRARVGLSDGTVDAFQGYTASLLATAGYKFVGAWSGDQLAAYMWILMVDDWASIGAYAANDFLRSCPNEGLINFILDYCLAQGRCREVIYGLSSIQETARSSSLDYFKKKVGFEARPVHRAFAFHPLVRPLINPLSNWALRGCVKLFPQSRMLRKASGVLANCLGSQSFLGADADKTATSHQQSSDIPEQHCE